MGIFAWLNKQLRCEGVMTPVKARPAQEVSPVKAIKLDEISEPVRSLLEALTRDEWELYDDPQPIGYGSEYAILVNVYYEHIYLMVECPGRLRKTWCLLQNEWMTDSERDLVARRVAYRVEKLKHITTRARRNMSRSKFMVFVKEPV